MAHNLKRFIKEHMPVIGIITALLVITSIYAVSYIMYQNQAIDATNAVTQANTKASDALITKIKQEKAEGTQNAYQAVSKVQAPPTYSSSQTAATLSCNVSTVHNDPSSIDVLVNKKHCLVPLSFYPSDLVAIDSATLSAKAATSFDLMYKAAAADGQSFSVSSSYRSYATQVTTYNYWISISGQTAADTYSARPGYSEHQTGLAVDLNAGSCSLSCFINTTQYTWLKEHAAEYGFVQRYPAGKQSITGYESEEWHYRFVGTTVAQDMKTRGITTLEEYWNMSGGDY